MRDGPHRNLPLSRGWKRVAERLDDENYGVAEVGDAWRQALREDWQSDGVADFWPRLCSVLLQPDTIFPLAVQLDMLRHQADGHGTRTELLELASDLGEAPRREEECVGIVRQALLQVSVRRKNQIVAHYHGEAPPHGASIERRLDDQWPELEQSVNELAEELAMGRGEAVVRRRRDGLDDGVPV